MSILLNRYAGKISFFSPLRAPPDDNTLGFSIPDNDDNNGGDENDNGDDDDDDSSGGDEENQNGGKPPKKKEKNPDDFGFEDIMGGDDDGTISIDDDDDDGDEPDEAQVEAGKALTTKLKGLIGGFAITENDIPDNLDLSDKAGVAKFITSSNQKTLQQSLQMMAPVISHALGIAVSKLEKRIDKSVTRTGKQSDAQKAFDGLGFEKGADRTLAKTFFERAVKNNMTVGQAATATRRAMAQLGKQGKAGGGTSRNNGGTSGIKRGAEALDDIFK